MNQIDCSKLFLSHTKFDEVKINHALEAYGIRERVAFGNTLNFCRYVRGDTASNDIDTLLAFYNIKPAGERHRALSDVCALREIFNKMLENKTGDVIKYLFSFFEPTVEIKTPPVITAQVVAETETAHIQVGIAPQNSIQRPKERLVVRLQTTKTISK